MPTPRIGQSPDDTVFPQSHDEHLSLSQFQTLQFAKHSINSSLNPTKREASHLHTLAFLPHTVLTKLTSNIGVVHSRLQDALEVASLRGSHVRDTNTATLERAVVQARRHVRRNGTAEVAAVEVGAARNDEGLLTHACGTGREDAVAVGGAGDAVSGTESGGRGSRGCFGGASEGGAFDLGAVM